MGSTTPPTSGPRLLCLVRAGEALPFRIAANDLSANGRPGDIELQMRLALIARSPTIRRWARIWLEDYEVVVLEEEAAA